MQKNLTAICAAVGALTTSLGAIAQTSQTTSTLPTVSVTASQQNRQTLDQPSSTGSRLGLTPLETPASVSSLSAEDIAERGLTRAQDVAIRLPGLSQAPEPGNGGTGLSARGFGGHSSVAQMIEGTRLVVGFGTVTFPFSTWPMESVEVLSGPASVLHGDGAIGAAVNYVTKRPVFDRSEREAFLSVGSFNTVMGGVGLRGPVNDTVAYSLFVDASKSDGERRDSAYDRKNYALALAVRPNKDLTITLSLDGGHNDDARYFGTPLLDGQLDHRLIRTSFNVDDAVVKYNDNMWRAKVEYRVSDDVQLRNETYHLTTKRHWRNSEYYYFDTPTTVVRDGFSFLEILHDQKQTGDRFDMTLNGTVGGLKNRLVVGFDAYRTTLLHTNNSPYEAAGQVVDPYNVAPGHFQSDFPTEPGRHSRLTNAAVFAEDVLSLNEQWSLVAGLRRDSMKLDYDNLRTSVHQSSKYTPTTGRLGVVWSASKELSLYGQYSTGTDPLTGSLTLPAGQNNIQLTRGRQVEVGAKGLLPSVRGQWTVAAYQITKSNILSRDPVNPNITQQIGKQSSQGIELAVSMEPVRGWTVDANLAALRARYDSFNEAQSGGTLVSRDGNTPSGVPERTANLWTTYTFAPQWKAAVGAKYVGKVQSNAANTANLPDYTVMNASVAYAWTPRTTFMLGASNLANKVYAVSGYGGDYWVLGERRSVQATVRSSF